jgi:hypothetical protein
VEVLQPGSGQGTALLARSPSRHPWEVIDLPVWAESWVYECCGPERSVGEPVELELTVEGEMQYAEVADRITVLDDGRVSVVGQVVGPSSSSGHTSGVRIESGLLRFGISGEAPADRVLCVGRLAELRHGYPSWVTAGELVGIQWRPAIVVDRGGYAEIVDYGPGRALSRTGDWRPQDPTLAWAFELTLRIGT